MSEVQYFWECKLAFSKFLSINCFPNTYKRKYSLTGDGIYDLVILPKQNKIFEIKLTEVKKIPDEPNNQLTKNALKNKVIEQICNHIKREKWALHDGCIYMSYIGGWFGKVQVIEKRAMPE